MASRAKNKAEALSSEDIASLLDDLQSRIDRCKVMFEQYFLGIQKRPPSQIQIELERRIRKLTQTHISNTGLRFRFTTLSQKFASYNTYWKRTMRQIENGSYIRDIAKVGREAIRSGKDIPDELLAKMPKRMQERIRKDRAQVRERAEREQVKEDEHRASGMVRDNKPSNVHNLDGADLLEDLDLDSIFSGMLASNPEEETKPVIAPAPEARRTKRREADTEVDALLTQARAANTSKSPPLQGRRPPVPIAARPQPSARPAPASVKPPPGMSVSESQALYKQYKKARELVGGDNSKLSYDRLMRSLNKQAPKIISDHNASGVSFNVVVKGDRVVLKAKPKK